MSFSSQTCFFSDAVIMPSSLIFGPFPFARSLLTIDWTVEKRPDLLTIQTAKAIHSVSSEEELCPCKSSVRALIGKLKTQILSPKETTPQLSDLKQ